MCSKAKKATQAVKYCNMVKTQHTSSAAVRAGNAELALLMQHTPRGLDHVPAALTPHGCILKVVCEASPICVSFDIWVLIGAGRDVHDSVRRRDAIDITSIQRVPVYWFWELLHVFLACGSHNAAVKLC